MVELPFEDLRLRFYLTRPATGEPRPPVAMVWAGIDTWKEEMHVRLGALMRSRGFAVLLVDMPGVGESPVLADGDAERQWTPIFDWLADRDDLDGSRCAAIGGSFGGYWAMKLAYTHRDRLALRGQLGRRRAHHVHAGVAGALAQRLLLPDGPDGRRARGSSAARPSRTTSPAARSCRCSIRDCSTSRRAPLLLVNGRDDVQNSIDDIYLSLDHGDPKAARVFDGGHMGEGPVAPTIADWVTQMLDGDYPRSR